MNIGAAAQASQVSAKMIRYYESIGLLPKAARSAANYRVYSTDDANTLRFIHRARGFGFPIARIRALVALWQGRQPSQQVKDIALAQVAELRGKIAELTAMADALACLAASCHGDQRPQCPILEDLAAKQMGSRAPGPGGSRAKPSPYLDAPPNPEGRPARAKARSSSPNAMNT